MRQENYWELRIPLVQWFSTFLLLQSFDTGPLVAVTNNLKLFSSLLHNCNFVTVLNHNVTVFSSGLRWSLSKGHLTLRGILTHKMRIIALVPLFQGTCLHSKQNIWNIWPQLYREIVKLQAPASDTWSPGHHSIAGFVNFDCGMEEKIIIPCSTHTILKGLWSYLVPGNSVCLPVHNIES